MASVTDKSSTRCAGISESGLREAFDRIVERDRSRLHVQRFGVLGRHIHLHTVGAGLHRHLCAALAHLACPLAPKAARDLSIFMWDAELAGIAHSRADLSGSPDAEESIEVSGDNRQVSNLCGQWAVELDRVSAEIAGCARLAAPRPLLHDLGKPLQVLVSVWARDIGIPLVHAGMVARDGHGVLLGGAGGAGKSTTALACARAGFDFLGDDRVGLEESGAGFVAHSIYNSVLVEQRQLERFPVLSCRAIAPTHPVRERKPLVFLNEIWPRRLPPSARVQAVALPRVAGGAHSRLRPASPAEALRVIAPSSLILPLGPGPIGMSRMAALVRSVPCFWLDLGTDLDRIPACIETLLNRTSQ